MGGIIHCSISSQQLYIMMQNEDHRPISTSTGLSEGANSSIQPRASADFTELFSLTQELINQLYLEVEA